MWKKIRFEVLARILLSIGAMLPYLPLLKFDTLLVTDDGFASDIFHGELPYRVLTAEALRQGSFPLWSDKLCSGTGIGGFEPIGLLTFGLLPTAAALDAFLIIMLMIAAHGTYSYARRIGIDRPGAVLAGLAFAGSGYLVSQLKHLGIVSTVVWFPVGLTLLEGALSRVRASPIGVSEANPEPVDAFSPWQRAFYLFLFGLVFAEQILCGFPQSVYISALVYGAYSLFRASTLRGKVWRIPKALVWLGLSGGIVGAAMTAGAVVLRPLFATSETTLVARKVDFMWGSMIPYWPKNALTFLFPYINGDASDHTYEGTSVFWEDYGYVGIATFLLALYALVRERKRSHVIFLATITLVAYVMVLGRNTPIFYYAWQYLPGLKMFRFPTRFLFVVDFGIVVLGGVGLTRLGHDLARCLKKAAPKAPPWIVIALCAGTAMDLFIHQPRQNAMVPAEEWLSPPGIVRILRKEKGEVRTFTHHHRKMHRLLSDMAQGWSNLQFHHEFRESLQPNSGVYWGIPAADCYAGMAPRWVINTWGDHNEPGILLYRSMKGQPVEIPPRPSLLGMLGVSHLISSLDLQVEGYTLIASGELMNLYRVEGSRRVRMAAKALPAGDDSEAADLILDSRFSPDRDVVVHGAPPGFETKGKDVNSEDSTRKAEVIRRSATEVEIEASSPQGAYLFLAETYHPQWRATVDGAPTPVVRANIMGRAVWVPPGKHQILFTYKREAAALKNMWISGSAFLLLFVCAAMTGWYARKSRRTNALKS